MTWLDPLSRWLPLVAIFLISSCLLCTLGEYRFEVVLLLVATLSLTSLVLLFSRAPSAATLPSLAVMYALNSVTPFYYSGLVHADHSVLSWFLVKIMLRINLGACLLGLVALVAGRSGYARFFLTTGCVSLILCRVFLLAASPQPDIDVFTIGTEGADRLLRGINPYAAIYPDIYHGRYAYAAIYLYLPTGLLMQSVARLLTGDIRFAFIFCDAAVAFLLYRLQPLRPPLQRLLLAAVWLSYPAWLGMLERAWIDTFLIFFLTLSIWLADRNRHLACGVALGMLCGVKQYGVLMPMLMLPWLQRRFGTRRLGQLCLAATATLACLMLPFIVAGGASFFRNTIDGVLALPVRSDALTLQALWLAQTGQHFSQTAVLAGYLISLAVLLIRLRQRPDLAQTLAALVALFSVVFLTGKQAFYNYYYLVAYLILLADIHRPQPESVPEGADRT